MVTIKKIEIKDYFGQGNFEWNLDPVVNILGGKNGSGKSTIFKLCHALLSNEKMDESLDNRFKKVFKEATLTFSNGWTLTWMTTKSYTATLHLDGGKASILRNVSKVADEKGQAVDFKKLQQLIKVYMINSFEQHVDKAILYKMVYSSLNCFLQEYDSKIDSSFEFTKAGKQISYENLSMGEKQILLLLLMVSNTKQEPCIFFMDEPDLSMHIDWKEILIKELHNLNPNMQIILSTHAPSVITGWHDKVKEVNQLIKK